MPEPLAVAFVEVRPDVEDFRTNAEDELRAGLGDDALDIQGNFSLTGVDQARAQVDALATQTQQAIADLAAATSGDFAQGFVAGAQEAVATALELGDATDQLNENVISGEAARRAFAIANTQAAASERELAASTRASTRATVEADAAERDLFRARSRRSSLGPLRFAGVGLGAGVALFAATQALRDLGEALEVTGDEASTFEGKTRNAFANLLRGDLVGTFQALTNNTRTYSVEQLRLINQTPQLTDALKDMGEAGNLARSTQAALAGLTQTPLLLQTGLSREQSQGDVGGQLGILDEMIASNKEREAKARGVATTSAELNAALKPIFDERTRLKEQRDALVQQSNTGLAAPSRPASGTQELVDFISNELTQLQRERDDLRGQLPKGTQAGADLAKLREELGRVNRRIEEETGRITSEQQRHVEESRRGPHGLIGGNRPEALALADVDLSELAMLRQEKDRLIAAIAKKETEVGGLAASKDRLKAVNQLIEATIAEVRAEQDRHTKALLEGGLIGSLDTTALEAEARGDTGGQLRSLQAEALLIQGMLPLLKAADTNTSDLYEEYLARLVSLNSRIEQIQDGITSESERHATASRDKQDEADQAFLRSFEGRTHRANLRKMQAAATANLNDDIRASEALQRIYREEINQARKRIKDKELRDQTIANLTTQLLTEEQSEKELRQQERQQRLDRQEERLDLNIQLAQANENIRAEIRAHEAKIKYLQERIRHTREGTNQRRRLRVEIAQERAEIRRLNEEMDKASDDTANFGAMATAFLQQLHGFSSNLATNTFPRGSNLTGASNLTTTPPSTGPSTPREFIETTKPPPASRPDDRLPSPFEHGRGAGTRPTQPGAASDLRDSRGAPLNQGQGEELIHIGKQTVLLLKDIKAGMGHNEASTSRKLGRNAHTVGVD